MLNWADELLGSCDAVVGGRTCFSAALASLLKMLLGAWKHKSVCVCARALLGLHRSVPHPRSLFTRAVHRDRGSEHGC